MNISIVKVGHDVSSVVVDVAAATVVEWAVVTRCSSSYYCYVVIPRNSLYCYVVSPRN